MNKLYIIILSSLLFICLSCQQQTPKTQIEQTAIDFCEAFYNFNYPVAQELSTPSSLSYLSFLASNVRQVHLNQLNTLQDTLELTREYDKWLIKKDIPLRNGKQNHD